MIYLDNAATSMAKPKYVISKMNKYQKTLSVNAGRGGHRYSVEGIEKILDTADALAELFNIDDPQRIAFLPNATYALNSAIGGLCTRNDHAIVTQMEHNSVLRPVHLLTNYTVVKADSLGYVNPHNIETAIKPNTKLIVCTHASNVTGSIQPVEQIGKIAKQHNIPFLVDCAQTAGAINVDVSRMNADMIAFSGHKGLMAPLGTGGLYVRNGLELKPMITGGTGSNSESLIHPTQMPDIFHCGTINTPAIAAMNESIKYLNSRGINNIALEERHLAEMLINDLLNMDKVIVYGSKGDLPRNGTVSFNIEGMDSGEVSRILNDDFKIAVRAGYHCSPLAHKAIGTSNTGTVRASFGAFNTLHDQKKLSNSVYKIVKNL